MKKMLLASLVAAGLSSGAAVAAPAIDGKVKIGVIGDMGGVYADICGPGCVTATEMAIEDLVAKHLVSQLKSLVLTLN